MLRNLSIVVRTSAVIIKVRACVRAFPEELSVCNMLIQSRLGTRVLLMGFRSTLPTEMSKPTLFLLHMASSLLIESEAWTCPILCVLPLLPSTRASTKRVAWSILVHILGIIV